MWRFRFVVLSAWLLVCGWVWGQSVSQVKSDPAYLWAEGTGSTLYAADQMALQELMSQISYTISSEGYTRIGNRQQGESASTTTDFNQVIKTYSAATLNNTRRIIVEEHTDKRSKTYLVTVLRYLPKSEIDKLFASRSIKAQEFTRLARRDVARRQIGDALRYYYWALALVQSLHDPSVVQVPDSAGTMHPATTYLRECINAIFSALQARVVSHPEANTYEIAFSYRDEEAVSLHFQYWDGADWTAPMPVVAGRGWLELRPGYPAKVLRLRYEYQYLGESQFDKEVQQVLNAVAEKRFPQAETLIYLEKADARVGGLATLPKGWLRVSSFERVEQDLDARVHAPVLDQNGRKCALIKVETPEEDLYFDNAALGIVQTVQKEEGCWVYVPAGTSKLRVIHPQLGQLNTPDGYYYFQGGNAKEGMVYRMVLVTDATESRQEHNPRSSLPPSSPITASQPRSSIGWDKVGKINLDWLSVGVGSGTGIFQLRLEALRVRYYAFIITPGTFFYGTKDGWSWQPSAGFLLPIASSRHSLGLRVGPSCYFNRPLDETLGSTDKVSSADTYTNYSSSQYSYSTYDAHTAYSNAADYGVYDTDELASTYGTPLSVGQMQWWVHAELSWRWDFSAHFSGELYFRYDLSGFNAGYILHLRHRI